MINEVYIEIQNTLPDICKLDVISEQIDKNPAVVYLASMSIGSRRTLHQALDTIAAMLSNGKADAQTLPWQYLRFQHTAAIKSQLTDRYASATVNKMLSALKGVLRVCWRLGLMCAEDYHIATDLKQVPGERQPAGRSVLKAELQKLISACNLDRGAAGRRDLAILAVLYGCGLRRAEIVTLDMHHYLRGESALIVTGKGNKSRKVPLSSFVKQPLDNWVTARGSSPGPLFLRIRKGGIVLIDSRLTTQAIYHILNTRAIEAGIEKFSPHDLRRTFVGDLLDAGADIVTVQKLAGHANVTTTARYDRRGDEIKRRTVEMLHIDTNIDSSPG